LLSIIQAAGWPIWPLILCSIVGLALVIERSVMLRRGRVAPDKLLDEVVALTRTSLPSTDVIAKLGNSSALGSVLAAGLRAVVAEPRINEDTLRLVFENSGRVMVHRLERYLNTLGSIATAAPLLGLLGTVVGMIEIFGSQSPTGGANPAQLAQGIAIPALLFYRFFRGRVDEYTVDMEQAAERLVPHLMRFAVRRGSSAGASGASTP
jgi:biopolymer transport protein ExbB